MRVFVDVFDYFIVSADKEVDGEVALVTEL